MTHPRSWWNFIWQPCLASVFVIAVLMFMDQFSNSDVLWAVGAGALSSSSYLVFGKPSAISAQPKRIIGGYCVGILTGLILRLIIMQFHEYGTGFLGLTNFLFVGTVAAVSVGLCLLLMSLLKLEHPPAAGMALVLVIDMQDYSEIVLILLAALFLALMHRLLCNRLVDLL